MAVVSMTVEMALRPAARIVSPDSVRQVNLRPTRAWPPILTNQVDNAVGDAQCASSLNTTADVLDVGVGLLSSSVAVQLLALRLGLELQKVALGQVCEAGDNVLADQLLRGADVALFGDLDLQAAAAKVEVEDLLDAGRGRRRGHGLMFGDLVATSDSEVYATLSDKGGDIGGGEKDESNGKVLDEGNVEARVAVELNVGAVEEVETGLVEAALCGLRKSAEGTRARRREITDSWGRRRGGGR